MKYHLSLTPDEEKIVDEYKSQLGKLTDDELSERYKREIKIGITGVRRQALYIYAMGEVIYERFGYSPIKYEDCVLYIEKEKE